MEQSKVNELRWKVAEALGYKLGNWDDKWSIPDYPNDIAAAMGLEDSITEYDDCLKYSGCLIDIIKADELDPATALPWAWRVAHATPAQRCRAFLAWKASQ